MLIVVDHVHRCLQRVALPRSLLFSSLYAVIDCEGKHGLAAGQSIYNFECTLGVLLINKPEKRIP